MFLMGIIVICLSTLCIAQNSGSSTTSAPTSVSPTSSKTTLETLEALGVELLRSILSPSTNATSESTPTSSTLSTTSSNVTPAQTVASTANAAAPPSSAGAAAANANEHTTRNVIIVLATVLGSLLLLLIVLTLFFWLRRNGRSTLGHRAVTPLDDREIMSWRVPKEQRHQPYGPLLYVPQMPVQAATTRNSHPSQQFQSYDPFADPGARRSMEQVPSRSMDAPPLVAGTVSSEMTGHHRHSGSHSSEPNNWDLVAANNYPAFQRHFDGYSPLPIQQNQPFEHHELSHSSVPERVPTPMFGVGRERGEVAAPQSPRQYRNSSNGNGNGRGGQGASWIPQRSQRRPRSLTTSPLVPMEEGQSLRGRNEDFDFGFENTPTHGGRCSDPHNRF